MRDPDRFVVDVTNSLFVLVIALLRLQTHPRICTPCMTPIHEMAARDRCTERRRIRLAADRHRCAFVFDARIVTLLLYTSLKQNVCLFLVAPKTHRFAVM